MMKATVLSLGFIVAGSLLGLNQTYARVTEPQENLAAYCSRIFKAENKCPTDMCALGCYAGLIYEDCDVACEPKPCVEIDVNHCPASDCQILMGCNQKKVCYFKLEHEPLNCGDLAYTGDTECCPGLTKRCGMEFFDGTCDMLGENSIYSVPMCIPCGNGICNQFENSCNCPEDCLE